MRQSGQYLCVFFFFTISRKFEKSFQSLFYEAKSILEQYWLHKKMQMLRVKPRPLSYCEDQDFWGFVMGPLFMYAPFVLWTTTVSLVEHICSLLHVLCTYWHHNNAVIRLNLTLSST